MGETGFIAVDTRTGEAFVDTVSSTERRAKINYLVAIKGMMVFRHTPDHTIDSLFDELDGREIRHIKIDVVES